MCIRDRYLSRAVADGAAQRARVVREVLERQAALLRLGGGGEEPAQVLSLIHIYGMWATILFYPIWLFADNMFYAAYAEPTALSLTVAVVVFLTLTAGTVAFARLGQPVAAHRAALRGGDKATYLRREKVWAVVCVVVGCLMLAAATYYNLSLIHI